MIRGIESKRPTAYIVGGPNGSGKTTFLDGLFGSKHLVEIVNADIIASELNSDAPDKVAIKAGREVLKRLRQLRRTRKDFALEATLAGVWHAKYLRSLKIEGFKIVIFFIWLRNEELSVQRVNERHRIGGHYVPEEDVRRRYLRSAYNMQHLYRQLADDWFLFDNSSEFSPQLIASRENGKFQIVNKRIFAEIRKEVEIYGQSLKKN